jgi:hypothetical protein
MKTPSVFSIVRGADREHTSGFERSLISWRSVTAGLLVAMIAYFVSMAMGVGMGGFFASNMIEQGGSVSRLASGAVLWIGVSVFLSLAVGSYFAARTSRFITGRIGAAHGIVITALFFGILIYTTGQAIGFAGRGIGNLIGAVAVGTTNLSSNSMIQNAVESALYGIPLKSDPGVVAQGLLNRLFQGNPKAAKTYLSYQTNLSEAELNRRFNQIETEFKSGVQAAGVITADAVSSSAWSIFWIMTLGLAVSMLSGALGTRTNYKRPLADENIVEPFIAQPLAL